ncbi:MAG: 50S ribosomal protein L7ae-like protein [Clostridiales bacterium]|nr:50S ribosomal protein L7ae-like protein [Clostridiales bacterium]
MLNELTRADKVVGVKQVRRALASGQAKRLYLAKDADPQLTQPLEHQAQEAGVEVVWADTMKALGRACGIAVGASVAAIV